MSIENLNVIDFVSIDLNGNAVLTISDHLEWDSNNKHLLLLQEKINVYLSAIEGDSLYESYPNARGRSIVINVVAKYPPNEDGKVFLDRAKKILKESGYGFEFGVMPDQALYRGA